jgi:hypothetical protein
VKSSIARWLTAAAIVLAAPAALSAQTASTAKARADEPGLVGTWQAKTRPKQLKGKDVVQVVIIRGDSSASYGREIVRWRLAPKRGVVLLALGGEWVGYDFKVKGDQLTLSGGDLPESVSLRRVGPATPRPAGVQVPPDPDTEEY